ncbi:MAG: tetratricopeptide repeat protein [Chloroflexi bacterium]|nr:tetratricopeptide repeat protein [Chloroflexota bacterium]
MVENVAISASGEYAEARHPQLTLITSEWMSTQEAAARREPGRLDKKLRAIMKFLDVATKEGMTAEDWRMEARIWASLGEMDKALQYYSKAIEQYKGGDASSLKEQGDVFYSLRRYEEAVGVYHRALKLLPGDPALLNNLGSVLSDLGRREEALAPAQEAVALYRELAARRPEAFRPDLAGSLNNLANRLSELGRREEALAPAQEAVALRRELAARQPEAFRPDLAGSLNNLAAFLSALGRREEALAPAQEAVATLAPHFLALPPAFAPQMRATVGTYLGACRALGREPHAALLGPVLEVLEALGTKDSVGA